MSVVHSSIDALRKAVEASLHCGSLFTTKLTIHFRHDVYKYVFKDKRECLENDFSKEFFPPKWDVAFNKIGDGCRIQYPILFKPAIQWSKTTYVKDGDGTFVPKPRFCNEILHITLTKIRCN